MTYISVIKADAHLGEKALPIITLYRDPFWFKQEENTRISPRAQAVEWRAPLSISRLPTL